MTPDKSVAARVAPQGSVPWALAEGLAALQVRVAPNEILQTEIDDERVPHLIGTLAHHPPLARALMPLVQHFLTSDAILPRQRELLIIRVASRIGSEYELIHHRALAARCGITADELERVEGESLDDHWKPDERALLGMADDLLLTEDVGENAWNELRRHFTTPQIIEAIAVVVVYRAIGGVIAALRIQLEDQDALS